MSKCVRCGNGFDRGKTTDPLIQCKICKVQYHSTCAALNSEVHNVIDSRKNIWWVCDNCETMSDFLINIINKISSIERKVGENSDKLDKYGVKLNEISESCKLRVNKVNIGTPVSANRSKRTYAETIADACIDLTTPSASKVRKPNDSEQSAPILKEDYDPVLVIKAPEGVNTNDLERKVTQLLDPATDPVRSYNVTAQGKLLLHCKDHPSVSKIKQKLQQSMGATYSVDEPKPVLPRVRIAAVPAHLIEIQNEQSNDSTNTLTEEQNMEHDQTILTDDSYLLSKIHAQNQDIIPEKANIEVIQTRKRSDGKYDVTISCDSTTFKYMISAQKLRIGWSICRVYEQLNVTRCFKCNAFGHVANECKSTKTICPKCSGDHEFKQCTSQTQKCINCVRTNEKLKLNVPVSHSVWSYDCPTYQHRLNLKRQRTRYVK